MTTTSNKSPYLEKPQRLADIIAALQVMGSYPKFTSREHDKWEGKLGEPKSGSNWASVCGEHPEFFRVNKDYVSLRWRWSLDEDYDPDSKQRYTSEQVDEMEASQKKKLTRPPLDPAQIETLINSAISMHSRAIEDAQHRTWWLALLLPAITALIGALMGFLGAVYGR